MMRKKHLWIPLTLMLLASIAMVSVPVQSAPQPPPPEYETRLYIRESPPPADYINGTTVDLDPLGRFYVIVDIESPSAWDNTSLGIVGYGFDVHVDPNVLNVSTARSSKSGYFLYDYLVWNNISVEQGDPDGHPPELLITDINKTTGDMIEIGEVILGYKTLGVGAGGSSYNGSTYGSTYGLCRLRFKPLSQTAFTRIEIINAFWLDIKGDKHSFDVVDSGRYNPPDYHYLTVESTPMDGIDFTIDATTYTTNAPDIKLEQGNYIVTMPDPWMVGTDQYMFAEWDGGSNNPVRAISLFANDTITATYEHRQAGLVGKKAWPEHHHFDNSKSGDPGIPDSHDTPGNQTLYAKVRNIGEENVTAKVLFEVVRAQKIMVYTANVTLAPGTPFVILTANATTSNGDYVWGNDDIGKWKVTATCLFYNPYSDDWVAAALIKTFGFAVVA